ncbi:hypothetical protein BD413DRAFT_124384 [Trametes elegans]|nr:hypothetical protein BD413DRAFT_124384 [Trametes elegans]
MLFALKSLALAFGVVGAHGASSTSQPPNTHTDVFQTTTLSDGHTFLIPTGTLDVSVAQSYIGAHSAELISALGPTDAARVEGTIALAAALEGIGEASDLVVVEDYTRGVPIVKVSANAQGEFITVATGTVGSTTVFHGQTFTIAPNLSNAPSAAGVPHVLLAGCAAVLGSIFLGAAMIC